MRPLTRAILAPLLLLPLLLLFLPAALAAKWCIIEISQNVYECYEESECGSCDPTQLNDWCTTEQGGQLLTSSGTPPQCVEVCCCERPPAIGTISSEPVSQAFCNALITSTGDYMTRTPNGDGDCVATCSGSTGTGGTTTTFRVSGTVYDMADPSSPRRLDAVRISYPAGNTIRTVFTDADGAYYIPDVPRGLTPVKAWHGECGDQTRTEDVQADVTNLDFNLNCLTGGCDVGPVTDTTAVPVPGRAEVTVTWTPDTCHNLHGHLVYRCASDGTACFPAGYTGPDTGIFVDTAVPAGTGFCYDIRGLTNDGEEREQELADATNCILPMDPYCIDGGSTVPVCFNADTELNPVGADGSVLNPFTGSAWCDETNRLNVEECGGGTFCYYTSAGGTACRAPSDCELCNGLLGWFIDVSARVTGSTSCEHLAGCLLDNTGYATDAFESCGETRSCYDYRSEDACETTGTTDRCHVSTDGCSWIAAPGIGELGFGACVPNALEDERCDACDAIFGFCNASLCEMLGESCHYNELAPLVDDGEPVGCVHRDEMACRFYDTMESCIGAGGAARPSIDVTYDLPDSLTGTRTSGTNAVSRPSNDRFSYGRCAWITDAANYPETGGYCIKDANGRIAGIPWLDDRKEDDCLEVRGQHYAGGLAACLRDTTPPVTTLPLEPNSFIDASLLRSAVPIVSDDLFAPTDIDSWFCLAQGAATCYPDRRFDNLVPAEVGVAPYTIYYYSEDPAGNLETVRSVSVNIEQDSAARLVEAVLVD